MPYASSAVVQFRLLSSLNLNTSYSKSVWMDK